MKKENIKVSSFFFVSFSLAAFVLVSFSYLFLSARVNYTRADKQEYKIEEVYVNDNYNNNDPYITKASSLKNVIDGPIISNFDPHLGNFDAPIKIIVYSDFTCHYCLEQEKVIKNILKKYEGKVRYIWKDYPKTDIESISFKSSLAARCAQNQDKFWEFHDLLFERSVAGDDDIYDIVNDIGLNSDEFKSCYENKETMPLIADNIEEANLIGIIGVPNVYINDKEFIGNVNEEDFSLVIDSILKNE